jgi:hypothetical protein
MDPSLARLMPRSPQELLDVATLLEAHRAFVERCGCAWPALGEMDPALIRSALRAVRRARRPPIRGSIK